MPTAFPAQFVTRCAARCGNPINPDDPIVMEDDGAVHKHCAQAPKKTPAPVQYPMCTVCWLRHAEGDCDRD